jgi:hypothetical protein
MPRLHRAHLGTLQNKNGINGNLLDPTVRSEQPPNSSNFSRFVTSAITLEPAPRREARTRTRGDEEL